jgi:hypothetical protein
VIASHVPPESMREHACSFCLSPATQAEALMTVGRLCVGAPLHADDTTLLHPTLMGEEYCHDEYPRP